jgi:alpha-tubulin suppressor-like RCC1 family protein
VLDMYRVACGNEHIVALVEGRDGADCYSWDSNSYGQLGLGMYILLGPLRSF